MSDPTQDNIDQRPARPLTYAEMTAGLVWPVLFRSVVMALQPARLLIAFILIVLLGVIATVFDAVLGWIGSEPVARGMLTGIGAGLGDFRDQALALQPGRALESLYRAFTGGPSGLLEAHWIALPVFILLVLPVWATLGGALSRMVATDIAGHLSMTARDGLVFAASKAPSFVSALLLPLIGMLLIAGAMALAGWVLLTVPGVQVVGGLLYGGLLLVGLLLTFLFVSFVIGQALLIPAVATEGSDAIDAVQRAYAYLWGRPARALAYVGFSLVQGVVVFALVRWFVEGAVEMTEALSRAWLSGPATATVTMAGEGAESTFSARLIAGWNDIVLLVLPSFVVSFYFSASTIVYMLLRRINDEQDLQEIWMPGLVSGSLTAESSI